MRANFFTVLAFAIVGNSVNAFAAEQPQKFLVFDYKLDSKWINEHGAEYVFVWGVKHSAIDHYIRAAPNTELSDYHPYSRTPDGGEILQEWKQAHPDWITYKCDGKTPSFFPHDGNVPLDIANPNVVEWQVSSIVQRDLAAKTIAFDNYQLRNKLGICGVNDASGFQRRYTGQAWDPVYANDVVGWLENISGRLHRAGYKVVVNNIPDELITDGYPDVNSASTLTPRIIVAVDGILDEKANLVLRSGAVARHILGLIRQTQLQGKWMYLLYQITPLNADGAQSAVASYLMIAGPKTAMSLSDYDKDYGSEPRFFGFDRLIGTPCEEYRETDGLLTRRYDKGVAFFLLPGSPERQIVVPAGYERVTGAPLNEGARSLLKGSAGTVFYRRDGNGCSANL